MSIHRVVLWCLLKLSRESLTFKQISERRCESRGAPAVPREVTLVSHLVLEEARRLHEQEIAKTEFLLNKGRTLLTIVGLLLPLAGAAVLSTDANLAIWVLPAAVLAAAVFLLTELFSLQIAADTALDDELLRAETEETKVLFQAYVTARDVNKRSNNYQLALYGGAWRFFIFGLLSLFVSLPVSVSDRPSNSETLISDVDILRGPPGPRGPMGPPGPPGPRGAPAPTALEGEAPATGLKQARASESAAKERR